MIVKTTTGSTVNLVDNDKQCLYDSNGVTWERYPDMDCPNPFRLAYRETKARVSVICLTMEETKRIMNGVHAMLTPTTLEEMKYHILTLANRYKEIANGWSDHQLREILSEAVKKHQNPGTVLEARIYAVIEAEKAVKRAQEEQGHTEMHEGAKEKPKEARLVQRGYKNTPRRRTQEGSLSVTSGDISVVLTPKQLEFMERLSECPGWKDTGVGGEYVASQYAEELSDTMNPMSVGAVVTTLREKGLLTTKKTRIGGIKCCMFKLTDIGISVYKELAGGRK